MGYTASDENTARLVQASSVFLLLGQVATAAPGIVFQTSVAPQTDEDLASPCRYEVTLIDPSRIVRGVWVIFDRSRDMLRYYGDPDVRAFARAPRFRASVFVSLRVEIAGLERDMNMDPSKGMGRALFSALSQFAESSGHPELASAKVFLWVFQERVLSLDGLRSLRRTGCWRSLPPIQATSSHLASIRSIFPRRPRRFRN